MSKTNTVTFTAPKKRDNKHIGKKVFGRTVVDYKPMKENSWDSDPRKVNFMDESGMFGNLNTEK